VPLECQPKVVWEMPELAHDLMRPLSLTIVVLHQTGNNKWRNKTGVTFFIDDKIDTGA
jgi:hypothetical protein